MRLRKLDVHPLHIPFKTTVKHNAATRQATSAMLVFARSEDGNVGVGEGCPRAYVTGETLKSASNFVLRHRDVLCAQVRDVTTLRAWMHQHTREIDRNPAAWCAIELALLDCLGRCESKSLETLLELPALTETFYYSAVISDAAPPVFKRYAQKYLSLGFKDFKLKLNGDLKRDKANLHSLGDTSDLRIRVDANNLWQDERHAITHLRSLDTDLFAVEEPIAAGRYNGLRTIADALQTRIVLDESFTHCRQLPQLKSGDHWVPNIRISKLGGLIRSLDAVQQARAAGLSIIVGAHVGETSILTRAALTVAAAARDLLLAQEGAFGERLLSFDLSQPSLSFKAGGVLRIADQLDPRAPGSGLTLCISTI